MKPSVGLFNLELEKELLKIQGELSSQTYRPGPYRQFLIFDPKKRLISAVPYRDRVVQHALCHVIEPIFDQTFIYDTYACRRGKGTHRAVDRFTRFCRINKNVLKCDISAYFDSIDHEILKGLIARKIKDKKTLWLMDLIISSYNPSTGKGIPIGNLTSQLFANIYLGGLDHFIKESLKCRYYIRYTDDFVVLNDDKTFLKEVKGAIAGYLTGLGLKMHPTKCVIFPVTQGTDFLGYKIYPDHRLVRRNNIRRFIRRLRKYCRMFLRGEIALDKIDRSIQSWAAHAANADSYGLLKKLGISQYRRRLLEQYSGQLADG